MTSCRSSGSRLDRWLAIDLVTCALIESYLAETKAELAAVGVELRDDA